MRLIFALLLFWFPALLSHAQTCTRPGQSPTSAFPLCGQKIFSQNSVPLCGGRNVPGPCGAGITDKNPFYYKFTCAAGGTLGFEITPNSAVSDYDWQLFDVTGKNAGDIFLDASLVVACNWSGEFGITGAGPAGNSLFVCEGLNQPLFSQMPILEQGHNYILLVSHFSNTQAGYNLVFKDGSADITDDTPPSMSFMRIACNATDIDVKLSKKVRCSSVQLNGSDFIIPNGVAISKVEAINCLNGFDTDSLHITLAQPLPAGTYQLLSKKGSDDNTIVDFCDNAMQESHSLVFMVEPSEPSIPDSVGKPACGPTQLKVYFPLEIDCKSLAPDGSDFKVSGPQAVQITKASGNCGTQGASMITLDLAAPIRVGGLYTLQVVSGTDGNTLTNICAKATPAGSSVSFTAISQPSVEVTERISASCTVDAIALSMPNATAGTTYTWFIDGKKFAGPAAVNYSWSPRSDKTFTYSLSAVNQVCNDTILLGTINTKRVLIEARIGVKQPAFACPGDPLNFADSSLGNPVSWQWNFGSGGSSNLQNPGNRIFPPNPSPQVQNVQTILTVTDAGGCTDTASVQVQVPNNCYIAVATGFTPNADGKNDFLYPLNAYKSTDLRFRVYNRFGQLVWDTSDWTRKWDGRINGTPAPAGAYVWMLSYTDTTTGERKQQKGTTVLIR